MPFAVMVPVHLDALFLDRPVLAVDPTLPYYRLPHHRDGVARNPDMPYLASSLSRTAFHELGRRLEPGVHLHWSMPDGLTHTTTDQLPALPNRWLVRRSGGALGERTWLIESDAVRFGERPDGPCTSIAWLHGEQPGAWLGRTTELADPWTTVDELSNDLDDSVERLTPVTADVGGELTFAALYPRCRGVFGFHDAEITEMFHPGIRYSLYGFHRGGEGDPVTTLDVGPAGTAAALAKHMAWSIDADDFERSVYFAALDFPFGSPDSWLFSTESTPDDPETDAGNRQAVDPAVDVDEAPVTVGLGLTAEEALATLLADAEATIRQDAGTVTGTHDDSKVEVEAALAAIRYLADHGEIDTDLDHALAEYRHGESFHASAGRARWVLRPRPKPDEADRVEPGPTLVAAMALLRTAQQQYDDAVEELESLRLALYSDWCRYLAAAYPPEGARIGDLPDLDEVRHYITDHQLAPYLDLRADTGRLGWVDLGDDQHVQPSIDEAHGGLPGRLAMMAVEYYLNVQAAIPVEAGKPLFDLVLAPGPRNWEPRELALAVSGEAARPTTRHGADGRHDSTGQLQCSRLWVNGPGSATAEQQRIFGWIGERFDGWSQSAEPTVEFSRAWEQPWHPLLLEWDVDYQPRAREQANTKHGPYRPDALTNNFELHPHLPELVARSEVEVPTTSPARLTGWSLLNRGAPRATIDGLDRYLDEVEAHSKTTASALTWLRDLRGRLGQAPPLLTAPLNGLNDALLMRRKWHQLPIRDPLALPASDYSQFASAVASAVGPVPGSAPDVDLEFHPIRTGYVRLQQLRLIDNFGLARRLGFGDQVHLPATLPEVELGHHAVLPPRLLRPSRLRFRWLDADLGDRTEAGDHPSATPVHGWLVIDHLDERIMVCDGSGRRVGVLRVRAESFVWTPESPEVVLDPVLTEVVTKLQGAKDYFVAFAAAMVASQELIDPADAGRHRGLAMLVSRPIAVTRAVVDLELAGLPPHSQSWPAFRRTLRSGERTEADLAHVQVSVRLGAPPPEAGATPRLDDGLLGFWSSDDVLRLAKTGSTHVLMAGHDDLDRPPAVAVSAAGEAVEVTMLLDPRGQVHAISGLLPTKRLALDGAAVAAIQRIEVSIEAGPILTRPDHIDFLVSPDSELAWVWIDHDDADSEQRAIEPLETQAPLPAKVMLRRGFLRLTAVDGKP